MSVPVRRAVVTTAVLTGAALVALFASTGLRARVLDAYVVTLAGVFVLMLMRWLGLLQTERTNSVFDQALAAMRTPASQTTELPLERDIELARASAFHFHQRLRPVFREIVMFRLRNEYGIDLADDAERARDVLPSELFATVRVDAPPPEDRLGPGPSVDELRRLVDALEKV